jgi:hypothetical protein
MRAIAALFTVCLLSAAYLRASEERGSDSARHKQLLIEILSLRVEVTEYLLQAQRANAVVMERELADIREQQNRLVSEERQHKEQIAELTQQLSSTDLEAEARLQIEAITSEMSGPALETLRSQQTALRQKERAQHDRLQQNAQQTGSVAKFEDGSGRVEVDADHPDRSVQGPPVPGRGDPAGSALVLAVSTRVPPCVRDADGTRPVHRPQLHLALGTGICARDRQALPTSSENDEQELPR